MPKSSPFVNPSQAVPQGRPGQITPPIIVDSGTTPSGPIAPPDVPGQAPIDYAPSDAAAHAQAVKTEE